jgi:hypothetical protein
MTVVVLLRKRATMMMWPLLHGSVPVRLQAVANVTLVADRQAGGSRAGGRGCTHSKWV